jgi:hypothetical protein
MNKINNKYQMTPTNQKAGLRDGSSQIHGDGSVRARAF